MSLMEGNQVRRYAPHIQSRHARAFSLIEILVSIVIIALLAALLLSGIARATVRARVLTAERGVDALVLGVRQFEDQFGFLPPLVHDGEVISQGDNARRPFIAQVEPQIDDGPLAERVTTGFRWEQLVVWSEGEDLDFFRRRSGRGADQIELVPGGPAWNDDEAWDDLRYSKFSLPYYLGGVGGVLLDGVQGPGMARPRADGNWEGVWRGTPARDRYDPVIDGEKSSLKLVFGYFEPAEYAEHGETAPTNVTPPDSHAAYVDPWGRAYRYYRWERGRYVGRRLVTETTLDLNIPPVLIDPVAMAAIRNDPANARTLPGGLTGDNAELRGARYAIVSAGPNKLFGNEPIDEIARVLREPVPTSLDGQAAMRKSAWDDNIVGLGN